jgi:hypothetical protein
MTGAPPFGRTWRRLYWVVAGLLAAEVLAFWLLARWAS